MLSAKRTGEEEGSMKQKVAKLLGVLCVLAAMLAAGLPVCGASAAQELPQPDSGIALDTTQLTLELTEDDPAPVAYLCVQAPNDYFFVIWSSSNSRVASVDGTGKVTGHAEGSAVITAYTERGEKAACEVTVVHGTVSRPVLSASSMELVITAKEPSPSQRLTLTGGDGAFTYVYQWVSSDPAVAAVSSRGVVTAKGSGRAVISALTSAGQVLRCTVTVSSEIGKVTVSKSAMLLPTVGTSQKLTAQAAGQPEAKLTWVSSNPAVAQVGADGTVTAVADGETAIMAVSEEGRRGACYVAVGAAAWRYRSEEELADVLTLAGQLPYSDGK